MVNTIDKNEVAKKNMGLVYSLVTKFVGRGIEYEELVSAGSVGLVKALNGFDETKGFKFSTYAVPLILGEIKTLFRDSGSIKVSRSLKELSMKAQRMREFLLSKLNAEPTIKQLANELGVSEEQLVEALDSAKPIVSLTAYDNDEEHTIDVPDLPKGIGLDSKIDLNAAILSLDEIEKKIITLRFFHSKTQAQIAEILEMSQVQISRKEKKILKFLRQQML